MKIAYILMNREVRKTREGYRLWETTTEGSPISPYFKTLEELCTWAADNATVFGDIKISAKAWKAKLTAKKPVFA